MSLSDDPLNNVSPKTRQRFENALARRRSKEGRSPAVIPSFVMQHVEVPAQQAQGSDSQAWVHWEYSTDEWALFDKIDWGFRRLALWVGAGGTLVFFIAMILPWFIFNLDTATGPVLVVFLSTLLLWITFLFLLMLSIHSYFDARTRHKARQKQPQTVTFSKQGVWEAGTYFPINERYGVDLITVRLTSQPPVLHFRVVKHYTDAESMPQTRTVRFHVLVPGGHEGEARLLLERFQTEVIAVRKQEEEQQRQAEERRLHPPEPH